MKNNKNYFWPIICVLAYVVGQIILVAWKLSGGLDMPWVLTLMPSIITIFAGVVAFVVCACMIGEISRYEDEENEE